MSRRVPYIIEKGKGGEKVYDLYSRLLKDRIVFVVGGIDDSLADDVVAQLLLLEANGPSQPVYMYINSPGGEMDAMYGIFDTMQYVTCPIITIGYGKVMSAASFLVAAGEPGKRYALPNTNFMIHEFSAGTNGKYQDMKQLQLQYDRSYDKMLDYYVKFTGQSKKTLVKDMSRDCFLTAEEAVSYGKLGLIDAIQTKSLRKADTQSAN